MRVLYNDEWKTKIHFDTSIFIKSGSMATTVTYTQD